jgi:transcriptional regulator with XRE-family HTH domain
MLGARLKYLREKKHLSQEEISKKLNMARSTYAHYELDKRNPSYDVIKIFANYFKVSTDFLLCRTDDPHPQNNILAILNQTPEEMELLEDIRKLKQHEQQIVKYTVKKLLKGEDEQAASGE